jgi:hypothetical protein
MSCASCASCVSCDGGGAHRYIVGTKADLLEEGVPRGVEASEVADYARQINAQVFDAPPYPLPTCDVGTRADLGWLI